MLIDDLTVWIMSILIILTKKSNACYSSILVKGIWLCEHRDYPTSRRVVVTLNGIWGPKICCPSLAVSVARTNLKICSRLFRLLLPPLFLIFVLLNQMLLHYCGHNLNSVISYIILIVGVHVRALCSLTPWRFKPSAPHQSEIDLHVGVK